MLSPTTRIPGPICARELLHHMELFTLPCQTQALPQKNFNTVHVILLQADKVQGIRFQGH